MVTKPRFNVVWISGDNMALQDKGFIQYNFENEKLFSDSVRKALSKIDDLSWPFNRIADDFYKSERAIFQLKSPGGYQDLSPRYKVIKLQKVGFLYPILKASGRLERSVTQRGAPDSILSVGKKILLIGTKTPYGIYHNADTPRKIIPQRKFMFIGPESRAFHAKDRQDQGGRVTRWTKTIEGYVTRVLEARS